VFLSRKDLGKSGIDGNMCRDKNFLPSPIIIIISILIRCNVNSRLPKESNSLFQRSTMMVVKYRFFCCTTKSQESSLSLSD
jgi:hypothetical protein